MLVTGSRLHAIRYFPRLRKLMEDQGLAYGPLVAFSGTARDPDSGAEYTERSLN
jgi:type I restriction enzyme R subunit